MSRAWLAIAAFAICHTAFAQSDQSVRTLARAAGAYIRVLEQIRVFKQTNCNYALKNKVYATPSALLTSEFLPLVPVKIRSQIEPGFNQEIPKLEPWAKEIVGKLIADAQNGLDEKTGCGVAAGTLTLMGSQAEGEWIAAKKLYNEK